MAEPRTTESLIWEARAQIMWGDAPEKVAEGLRAQGVDEQRIQEVLRASILERDTEIRRRGVRETILGGGLVALAVGAGFLIVASSTKANMGRLFGGCLLVGFYGVYRLARGLSWMYSGSKMRGSVAAMNQDIIE